MPTKKPVRKITFSEWEGMKKWCVVAVVKLYSEKREFYRVFGPYETRSKAVAGRAYYKKTLERGMRPGNPDGNVERYTITTTTLWDDSMFKGDREIVPDETPAEPAILDGFRPEALQGLLNAVHKNEVEDTNGT